MTMNEIKIFCPATIANLNCGFDVLGLCLEGIGDEMIIRTWSPILEMVNKYLGHVLKKIFYILGIEKHARKIYSLMFKEKNIRMRLTRMKFTIF